MALTILDYDKKVQNIPTRNISGQNNLGKLTKKTTKHMEFAKHVSGAWDVNDVMIAINVHPY